MNILELLKSSEKTALIQNGRRITYAQLLARGLSFGGRLRREGVGSGSFVLVFLPLSIELYTAMIGVWSVGAASIFIDFSRGSKFVSESIDRLKPDVMVCDNVTGLVRGFYPKMRSIKAVNIKSTGQATVIQKVDPDHPAILTFTSGSTGLPKVAVRTHGFLINQYHLLREHIDFDENHIDLGTLPVFTLANLAANMTTLLPPKSYRSKTNAKRLAKEMVCEQVTRAICSPALLASLLAHSDLPDLKAAYLGGGPVYPSILERVRRDVDLHIVYGSTEAEPIASIRWLDISEEDRRKIASGAGLLVGKVVPQVACKIGEGKEILVSGQTVLEGYLGGIGDSENKIRDGEQVWHRTGDAGYFDNKGRLWLLGRVSQAIRDGAGELYPFCVECVLDARFGIRGAVIEKDGARLLAIEQGAVSAEQVLEAIAPFKIARIVTVKKIPMDKRHGAKIDCEKLRGLIR